MNNCAYCRRLFLSGDVTCQGCGAPRELAQSENKLDAHQLIENGWISGVEAARMVGMSPSEFYGVRTFET